jgi:predicted enzyme related to lactoylglutathione lyase
MTDSAGKFVWYELMADDTKLAEDFYRHVVGWHSKDAGMAGMSYTLFMTGDAMVGGLMQLPKSARDAGGKPGWIGYVAVDDVDAYAAKVTKAGGSVHRQPDDIPGVGRFAIVADPQGATFALFSGSGEGQRPALRAPGNVGWHELAAADWRTDFDFYSSLFGWSKGDAIDMGPNGTYQTFAAGGEMIGGMRNSQGAAPHWLFYFNVDAIDAAKSRVEKGHGRVLTEPMQVPGGDWIMHCHDPQGAMFALVASRR